MALFMNFLSGAAWVAAVVLSAGYWIQIYKIHKHKEVRDLSIHSYVLFAVGYLLLGMEAYSINATVFVVKNILVLIPTIVIILQIRHHRDDKWND